MLQVIMAKRANKRPVRYEKDQLGCMWGLISMFDFRHGRSTRRLLSDRRRGNRNATGTRSPRNKLDMLSNSGENCQGTHEGEKKTTVTGACKPSVKKLIEEEMSIEHDTRTDKVEVESKQCDSEHGDQRKKNRKRIKKFRKKSSDNIEDMDAAENGESEGACHHKAEQKSTNSFDITNIMEEFCNQIHQKSINCVKHQQSGEVDMKTNQRSVDFEEKLSEAVKFLVSQKLINGNLLAEDGELQTSKELMDALQILGSDEELFLKLLRDPNSLLLRYVQELPDAQVNREEESKSLAECNSTEQEPVNSRQPDELINRKPRHFFRRKAKCQETDPSNGNRVSQTSNKIVILKPGPTPLQNPVSGSGLGSTPESHYIIRNQEQSEKVSSHFFLAEIKRKLKHAMGKEQHRISTDGNSKRFPAEHQNLGDSGVAKECVAINSPTKDHFFIERMTRPSTGFKKGEKTGKLKGSEIDMEHETAEFSKQKTSNIYLEAKKHLSEMINNGEEYADFSGRQVPKTLGRILSLPEYNSSPVGSPGRNWEQSFVTAHMKVTASEKFQNVNEDKEQNNISPISQATEDSDTHPCTSEDKTNNKVQEETLNITVEFVNDNKVDGAFSSITEEMNSEENLVGGAEIVEVAEAILLEERNHLNVSSEPSSSTITRDEKIDDMREVFDEKQDSECSKQDSCEEVQPPSSPLASPNSSLKKIEYPEGITDMQERSSPVSVLELPFTEDVISPASTRSHSAETSLQPLRIQFEEYGSFAANQGNHTKSCVDDKESVFEYIKAVLQASKLNWDELYIKSLSSDQLLDPSLLDELEFSPDQICHEQQLLFDCINEALMEVCGHYFGCSPWVSFVKPSIRPIPNMKNTIQEVWQGVCWHLLPMPLPRTLDQIVKKDMAKTGTWLDLRLDTDCISVEMSEAILEDLMEDTIISCMTVSSVSEYPVYPA